MSVLHLLGFGAISLASITETKGTEEFLTVLHNTFGKGNTRLVDTDNAFSVFLDTNRTRHSNIIVGRFCRRTKRGVIMDRRDRDVHNFSSGKTAPRRRGKDAGEDHTGH